MSEVGIVILSLIGIIIVFLICREIVCWYWKINTLVELMTEQNRLLSEIANKGSSLSHGSIHDSGNRHIENSSYSSVSPDVPTKVNYGETWICKKCSEKNPISSVMCKGCGEYK